jgi:colanic acid/amylovoran biosynthesis glycosyltransferase
MRVCYFVTEYPSVTHTFIRREIVELERNGVEILRVSLRKDGRKLLDPADLAEKTRTRYILDEGAQRVVGALFFWFTRSPRSLARAFAAAVRMMKRSSRAAPYHLAYFAEALVLGRWVVEEGAEHIHAHFGTNGAEVAMLSHILTAVPYSFTVHGPDEFDRPEYLGLPEKVTRAAFVCVVSSFTRSQLARWSPPDQWSKLKVVRCGVDSAFFAERPFTRIPKRGLLSVGRLSEQKGHLVLLEALAILAREGLLFQMTIVGDGPLRDLLVRRIRELGLVDRVELAGWKTNSEVAALVRRSRALVLPSFAEGLPVAIMEALALGRPVITTYVAGIPELVDQSCGWLVPAGDAQSLANAVRECLTTTPDAVILAMGQTGRKRVQERHDIATECRTLAALFSRHDERSASKSDDEKAVDRAATTTEAIESEVGVS